MPSKTREARLDQKAFWEAKLNQRLSLLKEKGLESRPIAKDIAIKSLRAKLRETESRLNAIDALEKKVQDMARLKAEKMAIPKEGKAKKKKGEEEPAVSKRQQKKKKKAEKKPKPKES